MKEKERDIVDELFREKLRYLEADTDPSDWEAIAARLPQRKVIPFRRRWLYGAAAVLAVLFVGGGSLYLSRKQPISADTPVAALIVSAEKETAPLPPAPPQAAVEEQAVESRQPAVAQSRAKNMDTERQKIAESAGQPKTEKAEKTEKIEAAKAGALTIESQTLIADAAPPVFTSGRSAKPSRKWAFGMGMGGLTQTSGGVVNTYVLRSSKLLEDEELLAINATSDQNLGKTPRTNIKHRTPIAFGLSVSRPLNTRFSFQTGLVYSLLLSDWETQATAYNTKTQQMLHFVGLPLSLSYKLGEWKRFQAYVSYGTLIEVNVAGVLKVKEYLNGLQTGISSENQRMQRWQWSVNARAGISYPLIPYVSAFAEIGAGYYFDNGSAIETIYSDKPFMFSPQIGFRLNF
jgi:hypothetical protein